MIVRQVIYLDPRNQEVNYEPGNFLDDLKLSNSTIEYYWEI